MITNSIQQESFLKKVFRETWRGCQTLRVLGSSFTSGQHGMPRLYCGGARSGDLGGPQVKLKRLLQYFPESFWRYNLVYLLSNAPYLSAAAIGWLKLRRIPIVLNQNGIFYPGWYGGDWRKMNTVMATAYHRADYVFWQSEFCRRAADRFLGKRDGAGEILFNAIDTRHHFRPSEMAGDRPFTFLLTGLINAHMGYRVASSIAGLSAARGMGLDCRLLVAGWIDASTLASSQSLALKLGVAAHVEFSGPYTQTLAPKIYQSADAYIMTKYLDPCPNTVLEAMACGLPVVYSASGGVSELVGPDAGVGLAISENWSDVMKTPCAEDIGAGMVEVARNSEAMGQAARSRAEAQFEITYWIDRHRDIFRQLLGERA